MEERIRRTKNTTVAGVHYQLPDQGRHVDNISKENLQAFKKARIVILRFDQYFNNDYVNQ